DLDQIGMTRQVDGAVCISVYGIALPQGAERREGILDEVEADGVQIERADVYRVHRRTVSNTTRTNGAVVGTSLGRCVRRLLPYELDVRPQPGDEDEVERALADDLVGDVDIAAFHVPRLGLHNQELAPAQPPTSTPLSGASCSFDQRADMSR